MSGPSVRIWMPLYIKDHRARCGTLTHTQRSALIYLHMLLWDHGGSIADDDQTIAAELDLTAKQWRTMRPRLLADCVLANGRITHPDLATQHLKAVRNQEQKSAAGRASAAARLGNARSTDVGTHVQPRADEGEGPSQVSKVIQLGTTRGAFG